jgi:hypothetical protein
MTLGIAIAMGDKMRLRGQSCIEMRELYN